MSQPRRKSPSHIEGLSILHVQREMACAHAKEIGTQRWCFDRSCLKLRQIRYEWSEQLSHVILGNVLLTTCEWLSVSVLNSIKKCF